MEVQSSLVNSRIDDLRRTARELHVVPAPTQPTASSLQGIRRSLGWRLIGLGLSLVSQGQSSSRPSMIRVV
jgi:hypothetical protein